MFLVSSLGGTFCLGLILKIFLRFFPPKSLYFYIWICGPFEVNSLCEVCDLDKFFFCALDVHKSSIHSLIVVFAILSKISWECVDWLLKLYPNILITYQYTYINYIVILRPQSNSIKHGLHCDMSYMYVIHSGHDHPPWLSLISSHLFLVFFPNRSWTGLMIDVSHSLRKLSLQLVVLFGRLGGVDLLQEVCWWRLFLKA